MSELNVLEICAGAGGQALGLEEAGFIHLAAVDIDPAACLTLRVNRPKWNVIEGDVREFDGSEYLGVDLLAGGVPCPPFSIAGRRLGSEDERDLFPTALRLAAVTRPRAILLENVPGLATKRFEAYRYSIQTELESLGYAVFWKILFAQDYSVPQMRSRFVLVALRGNCGNYFGWPDRTPTSMSVGETLRDLMSARKWRGAARWAQCATGLAPTIVGGSKLHGGPDLGPTRTKRVWRDYGVDGTGIADQAPEEGYDIEKFPKLTVRMCARLQGFPDSWEFVGRKTAAYRQVGNAFPPPVARALGNSIRSALRCNSAVRDESPLLTSSRTSAV